jgi:hypothetical protein
MLGDNVRELEIHGKVIRKCKYRTLKCASHRVPLCLYGIIVSVVMSPSRSNWFGNF